MSHVGICRESMVGGGDIKGHALKRGMCLNDMKNSREAGVARKKEKGGKTWEKWGRERGGESGWAGGGRWVFV